MFFAPAMSRVRREDTQFRKELGLGPPGLLNRVDAAAAVLCYSVSELDYPLPIPAKFRLVGTAVPPLPQAPADPALTRWLDAHPSLIHVRLATITRLTRAEIRSLQQVARRLDGLPARR